MPVPLPPDHPIALLTPAEKAALPSHSSGELTAVSLSGIGITSTGEMNRSTSKYLAMIHESMDDYSDILLTPEELKKISTTARVMKHGATASVPILCTGPLCIFAARCPFQQISKAPIGKPCIWELSLMKQWQLNYLEEYNVDMENFTEMTLINELVEIELHLHRVNLYLAKDAESAIGVVDNVVGVDKKGNTVVRKEISQHVELREKLFNRKHRLVKYLVGDRQEQYKKEAALKTRESRDPSSAMAGLREQMEALQRQLTVAATSVVDVTDNTIPPVEKKLPREASALHPDDLVADDE